MKTVQLTIDEDLLEAVDAAVKSSGTTRSEFTRKALREALNRRLERALEQKHREGYRKKPVGPREFKAWEREQAWGDA